MWTRPERHWRDALLRAALPEAPDTPALPESAWDAWQTAATPLARVGFRAAVWLMTWTTLCRYGRPLHRLSPERADLALTRWAARGDRISRQIVLLVKVMTALAADAARALEPPC